MNEQTPPPPPGPVTPSGPGRSPWPEGTAIPPVPAGHTPQGNGKLIGVVLALALVVGGAGYTGYRLLKDDESAAGPAHPDSWDPRVQPLVKQVERMRGLEFKEPVYVDFLTPKEYRAEATEDEGDLDDEDRKEIEQLTGFMRAVGVLEGDVDLFKEMNQVTGGGTLGFYSFDEERITVRGTKLTLALKATLVHELTHALQDQHFSIGDRMEEISESDDDIPSATAYRALIEGDADRIEAKWEKRLSPKQKRELRRQESRSRAGTGKALKDVPEFLTTMMGAPYALGEALLEVAGTDNDDIDELFENPPTTEEHMLDPWSLLRDEDEQIPVDVPELEEGEEEFDSGTFGSLGWYFVLAERVGVQQALRATDGWGGDAYVGFERDGVHCIRADYVGDSRSDLTEMTSALRTWSRQTPRSAKVSVDGSTLRFESCDPGTDVAVGKKQSDEALELALIRIYMTIGIDEDTSTKVARCFGLELAVRLSPAELQARTLSPGAQAEVAKIRELCF